jgi:hypothetical protein
MSYLEFIFGGPDAWEAPVRCSADTEPRSGRGERARAQRLRPRRTFDPWAPQVRRATHGLSICAESVRRHSAIDPEGRNV